MSRLTVALDLRHPLAYLALQPTVALARELSLDVDWLPLSVPTLRPPSARQAGDDRGVRHRRYRAQAIAREIEAYGAVQGLVLREPYRSAEVDAAILGWLWVREHQPGRLPAFLGALFAGYWSLDLDAARVDAVAGLVETVSADATAFLEWAVGEGPERARAVAAELEERGLFQVPAYAVEDEVFYGRQHLPMIRWILEGRSGPGPI